MKCIISELYFSNSGTKYWLSVFSHLILDFKKKLSCFPMECVCISQNKSFRPPNYEKESKFYYSLVEREKASSRSSQRFIVGKDILNKKTREKSKREIRMMKSQILLPDSRVGGCLVS